MWRSIKKLEHLWYTDLIFWNFLLTKLLCYWFMHCHWTYMQFEASHWPCSLDASLQMCEGRRLSSISFTCHESDPGATDFMSGMIWHLVFDDFYPGWWLVSWRVWAAFSTSRNLIQWSFNSMTNQFLSLHLCPLRPESCTLWLIRFTKTHKLMFWLIPTTCCDSLFYSVRFIQKFITARSHWVTVLCERRRVLCERRRVLCERRRVLRIGGLEADLPDERGH